MSSGSTVLRRDFDIFSMEPISTGAPSALAKARRAGAFGLSANFGRRQPCARGAAVGLVDNHPLREQTGERLGNVEMAGLAQAAREEARIEKMQDRVLDAADILVNGQPSIGDRRRERLGLVPRIGETGKIPGRVDERVHRVRFARRRPAAGRTRRVLPSRMMVERIAGPIEGDIFRQLDRQLLPRDGQGPALRAMDDRNRAAPIALA